MVEKLKWRGKRKPKVAPKEPDGFVRASRGAKVKKPRLYFKKAKAPKGWPEGKPYGAYYIYHHRREYSTGYGWDDKESADAEYQEFSRDVRRGREARKAPGQMTFADMIQSGLAFLKRNANTRGKQARLAKLRPQAAHWAQYFGKMKLNQYKPGDSDEFQTWWIKRRTAAYLANPDKRGSAANGANTLLRGLQRFCMDYARDHQTGWYPIIKIPDGEPIPPGPFFRRSEQAAMLLACRGWAKDPETGEWMTKTYVDENGVTRTTHRVLPDWVIKSRKGKSRFIRFCVRTGAREQDGESVVWGLATHTACLEVDDDGAGTFHRRGTEEIDTDKSRPSSLVHDRLKCLLRIWKKEDGQSGRITDLDRLSGVERKKHRYLVRKPNSDQPYRRISLAGIIRDAGLSKRYTEHALRRTAVEEAHLQCWSLATATHMVGMTAPVMLTHYTDWNERAKRSEAQALREANSTTNAAALRAVLHTPPEKGDRVRDWDRTTAARMAEWLAASAESDSEAQESPDQRVTMQAAFAALNAANVTTAAKRLRKNDLEKPEPEPGADGNEAFVPPVGAGPAELRAAS